METEKIGEGKHASLESLRAQIDDCDRQIIELLGRRFELVREIGIYKANHNLPIVDEVREAELLRDRKRRFPRGSNYALENIFKLIIEESRRLQAAVKKEVG
jgi:chorismate mutase